MIQTGARCLFSTKMFKMTQYNHLSKNTDDVVSLLKNTIRDGKVKHIEKKELWSRVAHSNQKSKKRVLGKIEYFAPCSSNVFCQFSSINKSLVGKLNNIYSTVLPVQEKVLPLTLGKRSVLIQSETGSGKTLTYIIPIINNLLNGSCTSNDRCLVIAPSKELCNQIHSVLLSLLPRSYLSDVVVLGADNVRKNSKIQNKQLVNGASVIISTPAPLNHKLRQGVLRLIDMGTVVIDEYDRLFRSDFEEQVNHVLAKVVIKNRFARSPPQIILVSATIPSDMRDHITKEIPDIEIVESDQVTPSRLSHQWVISPLHRRTETLLHLVGQHTNTDRETKRSIVFVQRKDIGEGVFSVLRDEGYFVTVIHGDMSETKRASIFKDFKAGHYDILVATDLIARGIDIPECEVVIQVQPGPDVDMYLHRAGRAARAGRPGTSYVIACDADIKDKETMRAVRQRVDGIDINNATSFLPEKESGVSSVLENALHYVTEKDELSFSVDITMTEPVLFYEKLVEDLGLRPVNAARVPKKRIFGLWFGSPIEAWAAQNVIKNYFKTNSLPPPDIGVYRHAVKNKRVIDWDDYFSNVRSEAKEESKLRYKNWVKSEMGKKRLRKGRYKFRETFR